MSACLETFANDGIVVVSIDEAPVNAITTGVRRSLFLALRRAEQDPHVRGVVVTGNDRIFSAGADLREFAEGTAMDPPSLHGDIIPLIASMTKPVVAAVRGAALGGGLELALGCHDRVFAEGTRIGLPETTLGLMPGAGGTQLLPRAIGLRRATELIVDGRVESIAQVAAAGLAHAVVAADRLLEVAVGRSAALCGASPPFRAIADAPIDDSDGLAYVAAVSAERAGRGDTLPGVLRALDAIAWTGERTIADGMRAEFALFEPLLESPESRALRHVFLAERRRKPGAEVDRMERAFVDRVRARLERERTRLARDGVDARTIARATASWTGGPHAAADGDDATSADFEAAAAQLLGAMIDEGRQALATGEAASEPDLDLAMVRAGGFPRVKGGPFFQAALLGVAERRGTDGQTADERSDER